MSLNETVSANRVHIAFFGRRNAGKSSVVNAVTNQNLSVVSEYKGTTTDPVKKAMELLPLGPVVITDTAGFDDEGELGALRVEKTREVLRRTDIAVLVADSQLGLGEAEEQLIREFSDRKLSYLVAYNKCDLLSDRPALPENALYVSALTGEGINALKERLASLMKERPAERKIVVDIMDGSTAVLVIPVDESAPKGRLILPQQLTIRELLDHHMTALCCQPEELKSLLNNLKEKPSIVITDSQAFERVSADTPDDIPLTSFSILFARYKGSLNMLVQGARAIGTLQDGDKVLIAEGCTHHRQCNDIGAMKMPHWIEEFSGKKPVYEFSSGAGYPDDLTQYKLIVHCGGCMLNEKEMQYRMKAAKDAGVPVVNYGMAIAHMHCILERALKPFERHMD